nr:MAG TPA: hypothetical protein [Caudoviricetes sp.]
MYNDSLVAVINVFKPCASNIGFVNMCWEERQVCHVLATFKRDSLFSN